MALTDAEATVPIKKLCHDQVQSNSNKQHLFIAISDVNNKIFKTLKRKEMQPMHQNKINCMHTHISTYKRENEIPFFTFKSIFT